MAISFLGWRAAGLPFAPFDIFDWLVRLLPGVVVTFAIDASVAVSRALGVTNIGVAAKAGDQALAIGGSLAAGVVAGAALFGVLSTSQEPALLFGGVLGAMLGGLALLAERRLQRVAAGAATANAWVFATCFAWGLAFGWIYDKLSTAADAGNTKESRRRFLSTLTGATIASAGLSTLAGVLVGRRSRAIAGPRWTDDHVLPNAASPVAPVPGTRAEFTRLEDFYRIDTDTRAPSLDGDRWRLAVSGLIARPLTMSLAELRAIEPLDQFATLCCISNPPGGDLISTTRWTGVSLQRLVPRLGLLPSATHLKIASADGFFETVALDTIRADARAMLVYAWDGVPLPVEHGFPLRLYVPDVYGMKQPKWIVAIEAVDRWEPGYWVVRGWSKDGRVQPFASVDAVVRGRGKAETGGIAYAGARGVAKVEVRGDDGEWHEATIRDPLSDLTWVIWRAEMPAARTYVARAVVRPERAALRTRA